MAQRKIPPKAARKTIKSEFKKAGSNLEALLDNEVSKRISAKEFALAEVKKSRTA